VEEIAANDTPTKDHASTEDEQIPAADSIEQDYLPQHGGVTSEEQRSPPSPDHHTELPLAGRHKKLNGRTQVVQSASEGSNSEAVKSSHRPGRSVVPPPVREAAFHGPPRFDWIDIENAAATKIQAAYRRNLMMNYLERNGLSTSAIRNRKRRRKAARKPQTSRLAQSEDAPSFFNCCAIGLAFGDATEEDDDAYRQFQKAQYEERKRQQAMHEDALRKQFMRKNFGDGSVTEALEIVED